jgi:D-lactate dehydrogenase
MRRARRESDPVPELTEALGAERVTSRAIDRHALAHDASHFRLIPRAVVRPGTLAEVARTLEVCDRHGLPLTFRSAGTSLSGQSVTDQILLDTRRGFRAVTVLDEGRRVRVQPGATVRSVNLRLAPYGRRLGPDPASEGTCTVGGVVANNSSGMQCGTTQNAYRTLESLVLVLPDGGVLDTAAPGAADDLARTRPDLHAGLLGLRERIRANPDSVATLKRQYAIKNTMGYGLNAFLDHDDPLDILAHLVVGSEGTLAFVAEATFHTVELLAHRSTCLLVFDDLAAAVGSVTALTETGAATIELMDSASLRVAGRDPQAPAELAGLAVGDRAALLVEYQARWSDELAGLTAAAGAALDGLPLAVPASSTTDPDARARLWRVRKGLFSAVASARPAGTNALLEDFAVPPERLAETCRELRGLLDRHGYRDAVMFGHAKDGNLHFLLTQRFDDPAHVRRYEEFTDDMVALVLSHGGTLKAEHGTGRMMAPYVSRQFGAELYGVMEQVKRLVDPRGILNPGVLIGADPSAHVRHLKTAPRVEDEVDRCVECGFCEPVCPSRDLTLTPRQRIVVRREIAAAAQAGDTRLAREMSADYEYDGVQTCAVDGMCAQACPVQINTGDLARRLRADAESAPAAALWRAGARHWSAVTTAGAGALTAADRLPAGMVAVAASRAARRVLGTDTVPLYDPLLPAGGERRPTLEHADPSAVLFASCIGHIFGPEPGEQGATAALLELCALAGVALRTPAAMAGLCCGTPWKSKGHLPGYELMRERVIPALVEATDHGRLPVVVDASSCAEGLSRMVSSQLEAESIKVLDASTFVAEELLDRLRIVERLPSLTLHPTCASEALGSTAAMVRIATAIADEVHVPVDWGCCGFAGDRGLLHPELTASATEAEAAEVSSLGCAAHASSNRTCELALTRATGRSYVSILELLAQASRP